MKILIADDHALMQAALAGMVAMIAPEACTTRVGDFPAAWAAAPGQDLILADLVMPGAAPVEGIRALRAAAPATPLLVVTGTEEDAMLLTLLALGIAGFVPKSVSGPVLEAAIRLVMAGGIYLPARLAALALARGELPPGAWAPGAAPPAAQTAPAIRSAAPSPAVAELTPRQLAVLAAIGDGLNTKEIATRLAIAPATVKAHTAAILDLLGASNRAHAIAIARARALI
ncbi:hypothetical protein IP88_07345 [alpha proteobacterium AAP81b]|nr:hypothetical protein IP88_07345 [alpha proteobacterium AAP81b]